MTIRITGMSCGHCEKAVTRALEGIPGVERVVSVSHIEGRARVEGNPDPKAVLAAIREEGYQAEAEVEE